MTHHDDKTMKVCIAATSLVAEFERLKVVEVHAATSTANLVGLYENFARIQAEKTIEALFDRFPELRAKAMEEM